MDIYKSLIEYGKVLRPYIGISGIDINEATAKQNNLPTGIYIKKIQNDSPATSSELKAGDVITAIDNQKVTTMSELNNLKDKKKIGDKVTVDVYRDGETKKIEITLGEQP